MSWSRPFDEPIVPPKGKPLVTLKDAANYIQKLPKAEQDLEEWLKEHDPGVAFEYEVLE